MSVYDQPMIFGKWKAHSILEVAQKDPKYVLWARTHIKGTYGTLLFNALLMTVSELGMNIPDYISSQQTELAIQSPEEMNRQFFIEKTKDGVKWKMLKNSFFQTEEFCIDTVNVLRKTFPEFQYRVIKQVTSVIYG